MPPHRLKKHGASPVISGQGTMFPDERPGRGEATRKAAPESACEESPVYKSLSLRSKKLFRCEFRGCKKTRETLKLTGEFGILFNRYHPWNLCKMEGYL